MTRSRDSQRSKVYKAEDDYRDTIGTPLIRDVPLIQRWVNCMVRSDWWAERYPHVIVVKVKDGRRRRIACAQYERPGIWAIKLPRHTRTRLIIVHEVAHTVTLVTEPWHGDVFVGNLLAFVDRWMGQLEGVALRWFLSKNRVKWEERNGRERIRE